MNYLLNEKKLKNINNRKGQNGITLIALVITIIVLLILAGISIMMLTGDNSILKNATDAKDATEIAQVEEAVKLAYASTIMDQYLDDEASTLEKIANQLEKNGYTVITESNSAPKVTGVTLDNTKVGIGETSNLTVTVEKEPAEGTKYYVENEGKYYEFTLENGEVKVEKGVTNVNGTEERDSYTITATSSDTSLATVGTVSGNEIPVTGVSAGTPNLNITVNGTKYEVAINVIQLATLSGISTTSLKLDGGYYLQATVSSGTTEDLIWSSDNTNIATVTSEGIIKCGTETGECTITVKGAGGTTKECKVTSTAKIVDAKSGNRTVNGQAGAYNNPTVPDGFMAIDTDYAKWSTTGEQTDINKGLVIMDNKGNEFVWIPVKEVTSGTYPMATQLSGTDSNGRQNYRGVLYDYASSDGTITKTAKSYSSSSGYREPAYLTNSTYADASSYNQDSNGNKIVTADSLQSEYNEMIEKVSNVGGFYIGRYESSLINDTTRVVAGATSMTAGSSSANTWYGLYARQKKFANDNSLTSVGSSMVWGSQWDAMLNWMIERNIDVTSSTPTTPEGTSTSKNTNRTTGTSSTDKLNNIYDILGNSYEWTVEADNATSRVGRGGSCNFSFSPSLRSSYYPYATGAFYSSRPTLYVK